MDFLLVIETPQIARANVRRRSKRSLKKRRCAKTDALRGAGRLIER